MTASLWPVTKVLISLRPPVLRHRTWWQCLWRQHVQQAHLAPASSLPIASWPLGIKVLISLRPPVLRHRTWRQCLWRYRVRQAHLAPASSLPTASWLLGIKVLISLRPPVLRRRTWWQCLWRHHVRHTHLAPASSLPTASWPLGIKVLISLRPPVLRHRTWWQCLWRHHARQAHLAPASSLPTASWPLGIKVLISLRPPVLRHRTWWQCLWRQHVRQAHLAPASSLPTASWPLGIKVLISLRPPVLRRRTWWQCLWRRRARQALLALVSSLPTASWPLGYQGGNFTPTTSAATSYVVAVPVEAPCPTGSSGTGVITADCVLDAGYQGGNFTPTTSAATSYVVAVPVEAPCPTGSSGTGVITADCVLDAGYQGGNFTPTTSAATSYVVAVPVEAPCPSMSIGSGVVSGCLCDATKGFTGIIMGIQTPPHFNSTCGLRLPPLTVELLGGSRRTVGRADRLELQAWLSVEDPTALYSWNCTNSAGVLLANLSSAVASSWSLAAADLEATTFCAVAAETGNRKVYARTLVMVEPGSKLPVMVTSPDGSRVNPARRLRLYGAVEGADAPVYVWTAQLHSNNTDTLEQSITLATATGLNSANLVVSPNQLLPNHRYLFTLAATTQFSDGVSTIEISINGPPIGGALSVIPTEGKAITDRFQLTAAAWTDDDLPCTYRFGTISQLQQSAYMYLTEYSVSPTTSTLLPAGRAADNNTVTVFVEVRDDLGSTALSAHNVTVMRFVPPENVSMSSFASSLLLDGPSGVLDATAAGQLIGSLAAALNAMMRVVMGMRRQAQKPWPREKC